MGIFKKEKQELLAFNLHDKENQKAIIKAALETKIPLINKGHGVFIVDMKHIKGDGLEKFLKLFMSISSNCNQGVVDKDDPKCDYYIIYDKKEE